VGAYRSRERAPLGAFLSERQGALHGRRKGKPLSPRRAGLMATLLPELALDVGAPSPGDVVNLFPQTPARVVCEIGFGGGEHLVAEATREPDAGFIGVEPFVNGMAKGVAAIDERALRNVRLFGADASLLLDWLPAASLDEVDLLYPDPWPKKRHWKRRFVSPQNLARLARALKPGGVFRFASDIASNVEWTLMHVARDDRFIWTAERADDWSRPFPHWPGTRYEAKALRAGRIPTYLEFRRL
jgi:tRNA (guanine-N7-)-methyltransferase